jgi:hypothetical protein
MPTADWACPVRITGVSWLGRKPRLIYGIDAIQALELAMQSARAKLREVKPPVSFLGSPGDVGISRTISSYLPAAFEARVDKAIEREWRRLARVKRPPGTLLEWTR